MKKLLHRVKHNASLLRLVNSLMKRRDTVGSMKQVNQLVRLAERQSSIEFLILLIEMEQPALKDPWRFIDIYLEINFTYQPIRAAVPTLSMQAFIMSINLDFWLFPTNLMLVLSPLSIFDEKLRFDFEHCEKRNIYEKLLELDVADQDKCALVTSLKNILHPDGLEHLLENSNRIILFKLLQRQDQMQPEMQKQLIEYMLSLTAEELDMFQTINEFSSLNVQTSLYILGDRIRLGRFSRYVRHIASMVDLDDIAFSEIDPVRILQTVNDWDKFEVEWERLEHLKLLSLGHVKALANDIDFLNKMLSARDHILPKQYNTMLIDDQNNQHAPVYCREGEIVSLQNGLGEVQFTLQDEFIYIEFMENRSRKSEDSVYSWKQIGRALHEYVFRESCVVPGIQGRIQLIAVSGAELFHSCCGFRIIPRCDVRNSSFNNKGLDDPGKELVARLKVFWTILANKEEVSVASMALNQVFQWLLDNAQLIAIQPPAYKNRLSLELKNRNIKAIFQLVAPSKNHEIDQYLAQGKGRQSQKNTSSYNMFLPYSSIIANGNRYNISTVTTFQSDQESMLYAAMHETDYQAYVTPDIECIIDTMIDKIQEMNQQNVSFASHEGLFVVEEGHAKLDVASYFSLA